MATDFLRILLNRMNLLEADHLVIVSIDAIPKEVQMDICHNLADKHPYFVQNNLTWEDAKDSLLGGIVDPVRVKMGVMPVETIYGTMHHHHSEAVVLKYQRMLEINPLFEFDPILVSYGKFYDGGHRLKAYHRAGRLMIPVVEAGHILEASNESWEEWFDGYDHTTETVRPSSVFSLS